MQSGDKSLIFAHHEDSRMQFFTNLGAKKHLTLESLIVEGEDQDKLKDWDDFKSNDEPEEFLLENKNDNTYDPELLQRVRRNLTSDAYNRNLSVEVTYEMFREVFCEGDQWEKTYQVSNISPIFIWSEIMCEIKGSAKSHLYPAGY